MAQPYKIVSVTTSEPRIFRQLVEGITVDYHSSDTKLYLPPKDPTDEYDFGTSYDIESRGYLGDRLLFTVSVTLMDGFTKKYAKVELDPVSSGGAKQKTCTKQTTKKYTTRPSPPYPANQCPPGSVRKGNNGKMFKSTPNVKGICRWVPVAKKTQKK